MSKNNIINFQKEKNLRTKKPNSWVNFALENNLPHPVEGYLTECKGIMDDFPPVSDAQISKQMEKARERIHIMESIAEYLDYPLGKVSFQEIESDPKITRIY
jgi:hypothetical protein